MPAPKSLRLNPFIRAIYVVSKLKHQPMWIELRNKGWPICSSWIDRVESKMGPSDFFYTNLWTDFHSEVRKCDALVCYREPGEVLKGGLIEIGLALALTRHVYLVGDFPREEVGTWIHHPYITMVPTIADLEPLSGFTKIIE